MIKWVCYPRFISYQCPAYVSTTFYGADGANCASRMVARVAAGVIVLYSFERIYKNIPLCYSFQIIRKTFYSKEIEEYWARNDLFIKNLN